MHKNRLFLSNMSQSVSRCHFSRFSVGFDFATYNFAFISAINQPFRNNLVIFQVYNDIFWHIIICFCMVYFDFFKFRIKFYGFYAEQDCIYLSRILITGL